MAYTTIDKPTDYFNTVLYTGNNSSSHSITGVGFQPDWVWIKPRNGTDGHVLTDSVRGALKRLRSEGTNAEDTLSGSLSSFDSDGFTVGNAGEVNSSSYNFVSWNWSAGGSAPAITYTVKVVSDSGNKYRFNDFGTSAVTLDLQEGGTYTFDQSDSSNSGHPLRFYTAADKSGGEYTTGVTTSGTAGSSGAKTVITVAASAPTLYYQCSSHAGMGGQANTNSTFGSSNFSGSIQANVSANTTAGFSIVSYTGTGSAATVGHGLSSTPQVYIIKNRSNARNWQSYHEPLGNQAYLRLNTTGAASTGASIWNNTSPTSSVFSIGTSSFDAVNASGDNYIAYCFADTGNKFFKAGSYTGNGSSDGSYIHLGFKPAFLMTKRTDSSGAWLMYDNKRNTFNLTDKKLLANESGAENNSTDPSGMTASTNNIDIVSNGFKQRTNNGYNNGSGATYIYMAFAENPFVTSTGIPTTAR